MAEATVSVVPARTIEISHGPRYDMVLNPSAERQDLVRELAGKIKDGVPDDWTLVNSETGGFKGLSYVDPDRRFFAQSRFMSGVVAKVFRRETNPGTSERKLQNLGNSVTNEMLLAPKIRDVLGSQEATDAVNQYGFQKVEFVEPLVGLIDRKTGGKALVYEYVDGGSVTLDNTTPEYASAAKFTEQLRDLFDRNGVIANDLDPKQLIVSRDKTTVYLLDTEQFVKK